MLFAVIFLSYCRINLSELNYKRQVVTTQWHCVQTSIFTLTALFHSTFIQHSKSPINAPPPGSLNGASMERDARVQSLSYMFFVVRSNGALYPGSLHSAPSASDTPHSDPFLLYLKGLSGWADTSLPNWNPIKSDAHSPRLLSITFKAPSNGAPLQVPLTELP